MKIGVINRGKVKKHQGKGIVCFLDVLGFSQEILNNWNSKKKDPLGKILKIKGNLPNSIPPGIYTKEEENDNFNTYECRVVSISDSIIICYGLDDQITFTEIIIGAYTVFNTAISLWKELIQANFTIRGAIDFGDIYWDENEIIGPCLINAYKLENNMAKTSRVIISSNLNKAIVNSYSKLKPEDKKLISLVLSCILRDIDGFLILNPQRMIENPIIDKLDDGNSDKIKSILVQNLYKMKEDSDDIIIKEKYTSLIHYLTMNTIKMIPISMLGNY